MLVANKVMEEAKRNSKKGLIVKLDFERHMKG